MPGFTGGVSCPTCKVFFNFDTGEPMSGWTEEGEVLELSVSLLCKRCDPERWTT